MKVGLDWLSEYADAGLPVRELADKLTMTGTMVEGIHRHGTSTPENDKMEAMSCTAVFGERMARLPISSNKSMIGHTLTAAGAVEAVMSLLTLATGRIPPTINYQVPDPAIPGSSRASSRSVSP